MSRFPAPQLFVRFIGVNYMFLTTEKTPYLLTILFLALGWTITQISTDLAKSPIIEYQSCKKNHPSETEHTFTITNISSEKLFTNLKFTLRPVDTTAKCLGEPEMIIPPPTELKGTSSDDSATQPECVDDKYAEYILPQFHPGASIQLVMKTDKNSDINIYVWCKEAVRLVELSFFKTTIVKERLEIMIWSIAIWAILIIIYTLIVHYKGINAQDGGGDT